jgi:hypothetical protein
MGLVTTDAFAPPFAIISPVCATVAVYRRGDVIDAPRIIS